MKIAELAFVIFFLNTLVFTPWIPPGHHHLESGDSLHLLKPSASAFDASGSLNSDQPGSLRQWPREIGKELILQATLYKNPNAQQNKRENTCIKKKKVKEYYH